MPRSVPEWIGKTDDAPIPARVARRVFDTWDGICHVSGRRIDPVRDEYQIDHIKALCNGGENRESNLAPILIEPHREKTRRDVAEKNKVERVRRKHLGIRSPSRMPGSRDSKFKKRMDGSVVLR